MKNRYGFTLVELMITVAIAAILTTMAAPSFSNFLQRERGTAAMNLFIGAMQEARSMAINNPNGGRVVMRATNFNSNIGWSGGWEIRADLNGDGVFQDNELINQQSAFAQGISLKAITSATLDDLEQLQAFAFTSQGRIRYSISAAEPALGIGGGVVMFRQCSGTGQLSQNIRINLNGSVSTHIEQNSNQELVKCA